MAAKQTKFKRVFADEVDATVLKQNGSAVAAGGDVTGPASSVDSELALFSGTGGKTLKRASLTGLVKATSGVPEAAVAGTDYVAPARAIATTAPLSGGGDLSADRTLSIANDGVGFTQLAPSVLKVATGVITSEQLLALHTTAVELIPAPGANKINVVAEMVWELDFGTVAYAGSGILRVSFGTTTGWGGGGAPPLISSLVSGSGSALVSSTSDNVSVFWGGGSQGVGILSTALNKAVSLSCDAAITTGDGVLRYTIFYRVVSTTV